MRGEGITTDGGPVATASYASGTSSEPLLGDTIGANLRRSIGRVPGNAIAEDLVGDTVLPQEHVLSFRRVAHWPAVLSVSPLDVG